MLTLDLTVRQGACGATLLTQPSVGSTVQFRTVETQPTNGGGNNPPQYPLVDNFKRKNISEAINSLRLGERISISLK